MGVMLAYIDPGSGAIVLQLIISAIVGAGIFFRNQVMGIFYLIFGKKSEKTAAQDDPPPGDSKES